MTEQLKNTYTHTEQILSKLFLIELQLRASTEVSIQDRNRRTTKRTKGGKKSTHPADCEVKL